MQEADEPGTGVRIRRARGDEDKLLLGPCSPSTLGELTALEGADTESGRPLSPGQQQHRSPGGHPGRQPAGSTGGSVLGGLVSKHGPSGARQKGGGGKGLHRTEFYQGPPRTTGPQRAKYQGSFLLVRQSASS